MAKTTNIYVRLEPGLKEQVETVLDQLGIPVSNAVNIFFRQVVMQRGLPFDVKISAPKPVAIDALSDSEIDSELAKGYSEFEQEKTKPADVVFSDLRRDYGL